MGGKTQQTNKRKEVLGLVVIRVGLLDKVTFEQRPDEGREPAMQITGRRDVQAEDCGWRGPS